MERDRFRGVREERVSVKKLVKETDSESEGVMT